MRVDIATALKHSAPASPNSNSARLKGVESDSALNKQVEKLVISTAYEKRQRQYQSAPRCFTYDKIDLENKRSKSMLLSGNQPVKDRASVHGSEGNINVGSKIEASKKMGASSTASSLGRAAGQEDRYVSTSYSESLDEILKTTKDPVHERHIKRLSILREEEKSRPSSAIYGPGGPQASQFSSSGSVPKVAQIKDSKGTPTHSGMHIFDDINYIQFNSDEIAAQQKKKVAKLVGRYAMGDELGKGSYGKVKEGFCVETLRRVAVKIMKTAALKKIQGGEQNVKREIAILKKLRHKQVVELMDVIYNNEKQKIYVVFEYCAGTMQDLLARSNNLKFPLSQAQRYFIQIVKGLGYVHSHGVIHRDIKPGNILITVDDQIKISDFGVAEEISLYQEHDYSTTSSGSPLFQPPEVTAGKDRFSGSKVDIWAIGVTLYHMISGRYPFDGESIFQLFENIARCEYYMPEEADTILSSLIAAILEKDPASRIDLNGISEHIWLKVQIPRDPHETPVIAPYIESQNGALSEYDSENPPLNPILDEALLSESISNPNFSYDTTLIPYLSNMFEDLPQKYRRSSLVELSNAARPSAKKAIAGKFLRRMSKPLVVSSPLTSESDTTEDVNPSRRSRAHSNASNQGSNKSSKTMFSSRTDSDKACKLQ